MPKLKPFKWSGFSNNEYHYYSHLEIADTAQLALKLAKLPFFKKFNEQYGHSSLSSMQRYQKIFLSRRNNDLNDPALFANIEKEKAVTVKKFSKELTKNAVTFGELLISQNIEAKRILIDFSHYLKRNSPTIDLNCIIETSLFFHRFLRSQKYSKVLEKSPFYWELGIDYMYNNHEFSLTEIQINGATRMGFMNNLTNSLLATYPQSKKIIDPDCHLSNVTAALLRTHHRVNQRNGENEISTLVIDAWAQLAHSSYSNQCVTQILPNVQYYLFDEFLKKTNFFSNSFIKSKFLFIINQAPLYILENSHPFFRKYFAEKIENYPQLSCKGLTQKVIAGKALLSTPPCLEIFNDKALIPLLYKFTEFLSGRKNPIHMVDALPLWDSNTSKNRPNMSLIQNLLANKNEWVLSHRYLEGGDGIVVGAYTTEKNWKNTIKFVCRRPYLFIARRYFPMNPAQSIRVFAVADGENISDPKMSIKLGNHFMGRANLNSPIDNVSSGGACFLVVEI